MDGKHCERQEVSLITWAFEVTRYLSKVLKLANRPFKQVVELRKIYRESIQILYI